MDAPNPPAQLPPAPHSYDNERFWCMLVHLTALTGFFSFAGFFLGPVVIWLMQRDRFPAVRAHFEEAINFQLSLILYSIAAFAFSVITLGFGLIVTGPLFVVIGIVDLILPIIAAMKASEGLSYHYPLTIRFIR